MATQSESVESRSGRIKRIGAVVPADLHTRAKIAAATRQVDLTSWLVEAIEEKLARQSREHLEVVR